MTRTKCKQTPFLHYPAMPASAPLFDSVDIRCPFLLWKATLGAMSMQQSLSGGLEAAERCFTGLNFPELWIKIAPSARGCPLLADSAHFRC